MGTFSLDTLSLNVSAMMADSEGVMQNILYSAIAPLLLASRQSGYYLSDNTVKVLSIYLFTYNNYYYYIS